MSPDTIVRQIPSDLRIESINLGIIAAEEYALPDAYLPTTTGALVKLQVEAHIIPNLDGNLLLDTNVISPNTTALDVRSETATIGKCNSI